MNLRKKKNLASRALGVGTNRIAFVDERLNEIKEAITKQDIKELAKDGAILIKPVHGRKKIEKMNSRSAGNIRKKLNMRKRNYVRLTRKLRNYLKEMNSQNKLNKNQIKDLRKKIRNSQFKSKTHLKEQILGGKNENTKKKKKRM